MPYELLVHREARKVLLELPGDVYRRVYRQLSELKQQARPRRAAKLKGREDLCRLAVARYRVIYHIDDRRQVLTVLHVRLRKGCGVPWLRKAPEQQFLDSRSPFSGGQVSRERRRRGRRMNVKPYLAMSERTYRAP